MSLTTEFKHAVAALPVTASDSGSDSDSDSEQGLLKNDEALFAFVSSFGTHFLSRVELGGAAVETSIFSQVRVQLTGTSTWACSYQ
jgi:hypothetical protein